MYTPRVGKILKNDYLALLSLIVATVVPTSLIIASLTGFGVTKRFRVIRVDNDVISMLPVLLLIFASGMLLLYFRVSFINKIFESGATTNGKILDVWIFKDRGRIEFEYEYAGHKFSSSMAIHASKEIKALQKGQEIQVIVDRTQPKRALIRDLYM